VLLLTIFDHVSI